MLKNLPAYAAQCFGLYAKIAGNVVLWYFGYDVRALLKEAYVSFLWCVINKRYLPVDEFVYQVLEHAVKHPKQVGV